MQLAGETEVDIGTGAVSYAKNSLIRRAGASPQQALFGRELTLPESVLGTPDKLGTAMTMTDETRLQRRAEIRSTACRAFFQYDLEQALARGANAQTRRYRGDYAPGDPVGVFWEYEGKNRRARFIRGRIIAEAAPEREGQVVTDRCWVEVDGRVLNVSKEELEENRPHRARTT